MSMRAVLSKSTDISAQSIRTIERCGIVRGSPSASYRLCFEAPLVLHLSDRVVAVQDARNRASMHTPSTAVLRSLARKREQIRNLRRSSSIRAWNYDALTLTHYKPFSDIL
jgi:hypothetical protein